MTQQAPTDQANAERDDEIQAEYRQLVLDSQLPCLTGEVEQIARGVRQKVCALYIEDLGRDVYAQITAEEEAAAEEADETAALPTGSRPVEPAPAPVEAGTTPPPAL